MGVVVRMDLQLYSIDSENYLVDFRNLGYRLIKQAPKIATPMTVYAPHPGAAGEEQQAESTGISPPQEGTGGMSTPLSSEPTSQHHAMLRQAAARASAGAGPDLTSTTSTATAREMWEAAAKARATGGVRDGSGKPPFKRANSAKSAYGAGGGGQVSSPFLFLECACRLIVELAVGSG